MSLKKQFFTLCLGGILSLGLAGSALGQTTYTWSDLTTGGSWSTTTNWSPNGNPGSAGVTTTDSANFNNIAVTSGTFSINYDTGASGYINGLSMVQTGTGNAGVTQLNVNKNLTLMGNSVMYDTISGPGETINLGSGISLTLASGATLAWGSATTPTEVNPNFAALVNNGAAFNINGTLEVINDTTGSYFASIGAASTTLASGATIDLQNQNNAGVNSRLVFSNNFTSNGGTIEFSGASVPSNGLYFQGVTTAINGGTTFVTAPSIGGTQTALGLSYTTIANMNFQDGQATQSISTGTSGGTTSAFNFLLRNTVASSTETKTVTAGAGTTIGLVGFTMAANSTLIYQLGSNLTLDSAAAGNSSNYAFYIGNGGIGSGTSTLGTTVANIEFDLNANTYDISNFAGGYTFGAVTTVGDSALYINNSSTTAAGTFKAQFFNLANNENYVGGNAGTNAGGSVTGGGNVILLATTAGKTNDLGTMTGGSGTMAAGTIFKYTGTGSANLQSTIGGTGTGRSIGGITVGTGSSASTLKLTSAITAAGPVTTTSSATLDLNNNALALSGTANLIGGGTLANTGGTATGNALTFGTGGLTPGGGVAGNSTATLTLNSNVGAVLNSGSTSVFNIMNSSSFDAILGGSVTEAGTLQINFLSGSTLTNGETFLLFNGTTTSGAFADAANVTLMGSNASLFTATFTSGDLLTINAVPEPSAMVLLVAGAVLLGLYGRRRSSTL